MRKQRKQFVDKKLIFKLRLFIILFTGMLSISIYEALQSYISIGWAIAGFIAGAAIGLLIGWGANVIWHEEANKVITKMDILSGVILVVYIIFAILRRWIFRHWFSGNELSAFIFCLSSGVMMGRFLSIRRQVVKILKAQGKY